MKIVILDSYTANPGDLSWDALARLGDLSVYDRTTGGEDETVARIGEAEAVLTNKTVLSAGVLKRCRALKYIGVLATGYNVVDLKQAAEQGIVVTNVPAYSTASVTQFTLALLLEVCHHVASHSDAVHSGQWENCSDFCFWNYPQIELAGKTLGIIGFGKIGQSVAAAAGTLGMKILAYSRTETEEGRKAGKYVDLDTLFRESDVISLHCPLTETTRNMINRDSISKMKKNVILLNTGRGPLICEEDLAEALNEGRIAAAAVDVVTEEPIRHENPLLTAKNCLITPHIAWASRESRERLISVAANNLEAFQKNAPVHVVN